MGEFGEQPPGQVLRTDQSRAQAIGRGDQKLGASLGGHRPNSTDRLAGGPPCLKSLKSLKSAESSGSFGVAYARSSGKRSGSGRWTRNYASIWSARAKRICVAA